MKRVIEFGDKINCLIAKREPVLIGLYQPRLDLRIDNSRGPHYDVLKKDSVVSKVKEFLALAGGAGAHIIIFPEFTIPIDILTAICERTIALQTGTMLILPLETMAANGYQEMTDHLRSNVYRLEAGALGSAHLGANWVNPCAIVAITTDGLEVFIQPKRYASTAESSNLRVGMDYFIFRGDGLAMTVFVCSDANDQGIYGPQINDTRREASGRYFIHTQWNPKPSYNIYDDFWGKIISSDSSSYNTLISINVASKSIIEKDGFPPETTSVPLTRIACSGDARRHEKYMDPKTFPAFKSTFENKNGHILNFVYPHGSGYIIEMGRPYELLNHVVNATRVFLIGCKMFVFEETRTREASKSEFMSFFRSDLTAKYADVSTESVEEFTFEEIEIFIASCILEERYKWLDRNILSRPLIWSAFYSSLGVVNPYSNESIDFFVKCLRKLTECRTRGYLPMALKKIDEYPMNLIHQDGNKYGWLFNCKSLSDVIIAECIGRLISDGTDIRKGSSVTLFPTNYTSEFRLEIVRKAAIMIDDPKDTSRKDYDVSDPKPSPFFEVIGL
jgi:hypothetical protein